MIKLEVTVRDVDFDALVDRFLPQVTEKLSRSGGALGALARNLPESMVRGIVARMSPQAKERLTVELIGSQKAAVIEKLEQAAGAQGISVSIADLSARTEETT